MLIHFILRLAMLTRATHRHRPDSIYSLSVPEMIRRAGYAVEIHEYTTSDGYVNTLHRIPASSNASSGGDGRSSRVGNRAVFLQHGLMGTSADFVMGCPAKSLGYLVADAGFDVWLGNARGNLYSRSHVNLTTSDSAYWRFSFDQMGAYDVPAALAYVRDVRAHERMQVDVDDKVIYIGHSMGTTMFWVAVDQDQARMESLVAEMVAMAPVAQLQHVKSPIRYLAPFARKIKLLLSWLGVDEFRPAGWFSDWLARLVCDETMEALKVCESMLFLLTGFDTTNTNTTLVPYILGHEPGGTSTLTVVHYAQEIQNGGRFQRFDYGDAKANIAHYGVPVPPAYNLSAIRMPVHLMYGRSDWLATPQDVLDNVYPRLTASTGRTVYSPDADYNHVDFLWATNVDTQVWAHIETILAKYHGVGGRVASSRPSATP